MRYPCTEFWMIEPEMAFADLPAIMQNAEDYIKFVVRTPEPCTLKPEP